MKPARKWLASLAAILLAALLTPGAWSQEALTARQILDKVDDLHRGASSQGVMTMEIVTENWSRSLTMEFWSKGKDLSLVRILAPKKEKGAATLRANNDVWNFLPKVKRVIKLPSSMMSASWMGSHFTNDDLVKESRMADDYTFGISFEGVREGTGVVEVACIPKPEAAVVWGKVVVLVRKSDYQPLSVAYFDEDMKLARTMDFSGFGDVGGRVLPRVMTLTPRDKPGEKTVVTYNEIAFDIALDESFFSLRTLQKP